MNPENVFYKEGYSEVNGLRMYYEIHGQGSPLVFIHGGGSTIGTSFGEILPLFAETHQVIAVELQAHGHTSDRNAPETFEQDADDVALLLQNLQIPHASFLGYSNGGNTAMQVAVRHPLAVDKLVLTSTFYQRDGLPPGFFEGMKQATLDDMPEVLKKAFLDINPDPSHLLAMFDKDRGRMLNFEDWKDELLRGIRVPTLIINGDRDVVSPEHMVKMSKIIPDCRLLILPAAHGAYMGVAESPAVANQIIRLTVEVIKDFLK
jgi:pimeloyl-ACP methyl ester carboxylesterase